MKLEGRRRSTNVEDRRGPGGRVAVAGGSGCLVLVVVVGGLLLGASPREILSVLSEVQPASPSQGPSTSGPVGPDAASDFVAAVLADTEDTWGALFAAAGSRYPEPTLVLFTGRVQSACGLASSAVGPFYCPADRQVYLDTTFFDDLSRRFGAPGDFAAAYVIAHEVGHHVQTVTGASERVRAAEERRPDQKNALSVLQELQADCYAGVWAHHAKVERDLLDQGDVEEGLRAAAAIGDDRLQQRSQGYVVPESFTHGTSAQRVEWFGVGLKTGDVGRCDTMAR